MDISMADATPFQLVAASGASNIPYHFGEWRVLLVAESDAAYTLTATATEPTGSYAACTAAAGTLSVALALLTAGAAAWMA